MLTDKIKQMQEEAVKKIEQMIDHAVDEIADEASELIDGAGTTEGVQERARSEISFIAAYLLDALTTIRKETLEAVVGMVKEKSRTKVYKLRKHSNPLSIAEITIPFEQSDAFRLGEKIALDDLVTSLQAEVEKLSTNQ